jgi:SAM-dependent methyltransferase
MSRGIQKRTVCRICGARDVRRFLHLPRMPLTDEFVTAAGRGSEFVADLDVFFCVACATVQTLHDVEAGDYYRAYRYTVSRSTLARQFMQELADASFRRFRLQPGDRVLEIGSGDGYQLACFQRLGARVLGFEPSAELVTASRAAGVDALPCLFTPETAARVPPELRPAQLVLLTYTFDHLRDPLACLAAIRSLLDPQRGVLVLEVHDLGEIIARREFCLFEHEHTIYLHVGSLSRLLARGGFQLVATELLAAPRRRANSLLVAAVPGSEVSQASGWAGVSRCGADAALRCVPANDTAAQALDDWTTYAHLAEHIERAATHLRQTVRRWRRAGRRVVGYGAGGRGVMTLAVARLTSDDLDFVCDANPALHGLYTPVTHVPIVAPTRLLTESVDDVIVFSYGYLDEIRTAYAGLAQRGGRFVSLLDLLTCAPS